jgi:hypothetical protein
MRIGNRRGRGSIATRGSQFKILDALGDWATRNAGAHPQPIEDRIPLKMVARPYFEYRMHLRVFGFEPTCVLKRNAYRFDQAILSNASMYFKAISNPPIVLIEAPVARVL